MIDLRYFKFRMCDKSWGSGEMVLSVTVFIIIFLLSI
jgi:hypothetical protein